MKPRVFVDDRMIGCDERSALFCVDCSDMPSKCREEFAEDADVNVILRRFGAVPPQLRQPVFGEQDFSLDLRDHLDAVRAAAESWQAVPLSVRRRYANWSELNEAVEQGHVRFGTRVSEGLEPVVPPVDSAKAEPAPKAGASSGDVAK